MRRPALCISTSEHFYSGPTTQERFLGAVDGAAGQEEEQRAVPVPHQRGWSAGRWGKRSDPEEDSGEAQHGGGNETVCPRFPKYQDPSGVPRAQTAVAVRTASKIRPLKETQDRRLV